MDGAAASRAAAAKDATWQATDSFMTIKIPKPDWSGATPTGPMRRYAGAFVKLLRGIGRLRPKPHAPPASRLAVPGFFPYRRALSRASVLLRNVKRAGSARPPHPEPAWAN